jgi:hypothetical protein
MGLLSYFRRPEPQPDTDHQLTVQARAIQHLVKHGWIDARTVQLMGTTDARKMFTRLRRKGYLYPLGDERAYQELPNSSGYGKYRMHYWSGKNPPKGRVA